MHVANDRAVSSELWALNPLFFMDDGDEGSHDDVGKNDEGCDKNDHASVDSLGCGEEQPFGQEQGADHSTASKRRGPATDKLFHPLNSTGRSTEVLSF